MRIFDISGCRAEIVRPGVNLTAWTAQALSVGSADTSPGGRGKLFAVCNASLYDLRSRVPVGTIVENGQLVHDDGNGYGCGVTWTEGALRFGQPWDRAWRDYLTGYNAPVQDGKYIAPPFSDPYVFICRLARIGVGRQAGRTVIVTDELATLKEFAEHAIASGLDTLVNLDGGGSRHLWYDGQAVFTSPRIPYNAIAFYKPSQSRPSAETAPPEGEPSPEGEPRCEFCTEDGRCGKWK